MAGMGGYRNPEFRMERSMNPGASMRQFRDPGLAGMGHMKAPRTGAMGLGSFGLHHTMPHLKNRAMHYQTGGSALQMAQTPNYNPLQADQAFRQFLSAAAKPSFGPQAFMRFSPPTFAAEGGEVDSEPDPQDPQEGSEPDPQELQSPDQEMSPEEVQEREVVQNAMAALEGQHPEPMEAIKAFVAQFGERALNDLQQLMSQQHDQGSEEDQEGGEGNGQDDEQTEMAQQMQAPAQAGGGLLRGPGTGQSDEIEGTTPSGHPVLLSDGEYVIDAPTVAALGDGSTEAGARRLDAFRKQVRKDSYGNTTQAKPLSKGGKTYVVKLK